VPEPLLANVTVPVGVTAVPEAVSATVAVQVELEFTGTEDGLHDTEVEVARMALMISEPF
jgi:hypothetical protein